jgi:hypothetical protein
VATRAQTQPVAEEAEDSTVAKVVSAGRGLSNLPKPRLNPNLNPKLLRPNLRLTSTALTGRTATARRHPATGTCSGGNPRTARPLSAVVRCARQAPLPDLSIARRRKSPFRRGRGSGPAAATPETWGLHQRARMTGRGQPEGLAPCRPSCPRAVRPQALAAPVTAWPN